MRQFLRYVVPLCLVGACASSAWGLSATYSFTSGPQAASATFEAVGSNLHVNLANTSSVPADKRRNVLTGVFFDIAGSPALSPVSATLPSGVNVVYDIPGGTGMDVGGEWAFRQGVAGYVDPYSGIGTPGGADYGISSTGWGDLFGPPHLVGGANLSGPASPNGIQYGIVGPGGPGNLRFRRKREPLIQDRAEFTLTGLGQSFSLDDVDNVWFIYGTDPTEPFFQATPPDDPDAPDPPQAVPEPMTLAGLMLAGGPIGLYLRRRRR